jgi:large repetitive protein
LFISLNPNEPFSLDFLGDSTFVICQGESILVNILTSGGLGFQNIEWVDAINGQVVSNTASLNTTPVVSTFYFITLTDGCTEPLTSTVVVTVNQLPDIQISADNIEGCFPVNVLFVNDTNPAESASCLWTFGDGDTFDGCVPSLIHTYESPGTYAPTFSVTTPEGCTATEVLNVPIIVHGYPEPDFTWNPQPSSLNTETQIFNQTPGVNQYFWTVDGEPASTVANPVFEFIGPDLFSYQICMTATSVFGCVSSICKTITIRPELLVFVPNAFTPDGDNLNEYFKPVVRGISDQDYSFMIFNRWGEKVFEATSPDMAWNGSHQRGEFFVEPGVYVWMLRVKDLVNGDKHVYNGHVTIVR